MRKKTAAAAQAHRLVRETVSTDAREAALLDQRDRLARRGRVREHDDVDQGPHDRAHRRLAQVEDLVDHLRFLGRDVGLARLHGEQGFQLLARHEVTRRRLPRSHEPQDDGHDAVGEAHQRRQCRGRPGEEPVHPEDEGRRPLPRHRLGDDLAEDEHDRRQQARDHDRGDGVEALKWYRMSADRGFAPALHHVGVMLEGGREGKGVGPLSGKIFLATAAYVKLGGDAKRSSTSRSRFRGSSSGARRA